MVRNLLIPALAALSLATPAVADSQPRLGSNLSLGGGEYSTGGGLTVAMETRKIGNHLGLCGAWAQSERLAVHARTAGKRILSKGRVFLNGQELSHDFRFLKQVRPAESYTGKPAGCVKLRQSWQPSYAQAKLDIRIPRQKVDMSDRSRKSGGNRVFFTYSGDPNPALQAGALLPAHITRPWSNRVLE